MSAIFSKTFLKVYDELSTFKYLISGLLLGGIGYACIFGLYLLLPENAERAVQHFLVHFAPTTLFEYLMLILIIALTEELFWRGYVQGFLMKYMRTSFAIVTAALLFSLPFLFNGFYLCSVATFICGIVFGILYERLRSMPLLVITHISLISLLFILLPLY
ncbi:CPBP family intramembrane glutamic endopeptidase [Kurthia senegalensis]|uniref:CPBP family intramembrane glutamic endopeptidase n=1 Tax=Kurthia senegalensis TaxID=1033740 RepID=UPI00164D17C7|nr:CPBP family intramembrane glutamic endopeptidase [Kurthia senegalensis]